MTITLGLVGEQTTTVTESLIATTFGSGSLPVYATPALIALMEAASVAAINHLLSPEQTSVGTFISVKHLAASALGQTIHARAEVTAVSDRQVSFTVQAWDSKQFVGEGTHTRFIVDIERFMKRLTA